LVSWPNVLVMRVRDDFRVMGGIIVTKDSLALTQIGIGIAHTNGIPKLGADDFIDVKVRVIPKYKPAAHQAIVIIGGDASDGFCDLADMDILPQAALDASQVIVNGHADTSAFCINWRMGSEVKYK